MQWTNLQLRNADDLKNFEIELNRRIRHFLNKIGAEQLTFKITDLSGTLSLAKGGTGQALLSPDSDKVLFFDFSESKISWMGNASETTDGYLKKEDWSTFNEKQSPNSVDGTFTTVDGKTITVTAGQITEIV